jgi:hypothetical protein
VGLTDLFNLDPPVVWSLLIGLTTLYGGFILARLRILE